jgi:hypothetical protein
LEPRGSLEDDLSLLQDALKPDTPAYILAKLDDPTTNSWLSISYVPDIANIRAKMLYAASRAAISKELGSSYFTDSIFATSLADLTSESYKAHKAHNAAPKPLSAKEREIQEAREAEKGSESVYEGSRARKNHVGNSVGMAWDPRSEAAIQSFAGSHLSELIILVSASYLTPKCLGLIHCRRSMLPARHCSCTLKKQRSQPTMLAPDYLNLKLVSQTPRRMPGSNRAKVSSAYALYRWKHIEDDQNREDIGELSGLFVNVD